MRGRDLLRRVHTDVGAELEKSCSNKGHVRVWTVHLCKRGAGSGRAAESKAQPPLPWVYARTDSGRCPARSRRLVACLRVAPLALVRPCSSPHHTFYHSLLIVNNRAHTSVLMSVLYPMLFLWSLGAHALLGPGAPVYLLCSTGVLHAN